MGNEPRNQASEQISARYPTFSRLPEMTEAEIEVFSRNYADDFVREDRRRFVTIPSASFDEFVASLRTYWELGSGTPQFSVAEVIAVRGDRLVLFTSRVEFGDGTSTESLVVLEYDERMRAQRATMFDIDDLDTAYAELERRHAAID